MTCAKCGAPATKRFSPDLDINGIGSCDEHIEDVRLAYMALLQGGEPNLGEEIINEWQKQVKHLPNKENK